MAKVALVVISTGEKYWPYIEPLLDSAERYFVPHATLLWTDCPAQFRCQSISYSNLGYPQATLKRYHAFLQAEDRLREFDYIFYSDVDMRFVGRISEEIFSDGITATEHPGYVGRAGTPELRPESTAYAPVLKKYFCGGFLGGTSEAFLTMARTIRQNVDADEKNGIVAVWHDESHLNRYLFDNPPAKILSPAFCYPETNQEFYRGVWGRDYEPKILALTKNQ